MLIPPPDEYSSLVAIVVLIGRVAESLRTASVDSGMPCLVANTAESVRAFVGSVL